VNHREPNRASRDEFDALVNAASEVTLSGWDFSFLADRMSSEALPWNYVDLARRAAQRAACVLDIDTGGGEVLATISPPPGSIALEPYPPNVPLAAATLKPLGIEVRYRPTCQLPVSDAAFDLVLNRHGALDATEVARVLAPGGVFLTQQVGSSNDIEFGEALGLASAGSDSALETLAQARQTLEDVGLKITRAAEAWPRTHYLDIGAVILQLRAVPWQVPGFDVAEHRNRLWAIHQSIIEEGSFTVTSHRLLLEAARV
jgi:SAM-dependent methyltransferase